MSRTGGVVLLLVTLVMVISAAAYAADVIIVTPSNETASGWKHTATYGAVGGFSVVPAGASTGGFFASTGSNADINGDYCGQVFLGTNNYSGIFLKDIRKLQYNCFTGDFTSFAVNHFPRTPFQLQLAVISDGTTGVKDYHYLMYRAWDWHYQDTYDQQLCYPYSGEGVPVPGGTFTKWYNEWQTYDALTSTYGCWVDFTNTNFYPVGNPYRPFVGSWARVLRRYPNGMLMLPDGVTQDWPIAWGNKSGHNPNGTCLNLAVGSPHNEYGTSVNLSWHDNINFRGFVESLTIGYYAVPGNTNTYVEKTILFRPDWNPRALCTTAKNAARKTIIDKAKMGNYFVLYGRVLPDMSNSEFTIEDKSGVRVKVKCFYHYRLPGQFVRVKGVLDRYGADGSMPTVLAHYADVFNVPNY